MIVIDIDMPKAPVGSVRCLVCPMRNPMTDECMGQSIEDNMASNNSWEEQLKKCPIKGTVDKNKVNEVLRKWRETH